MLEMQSGGSGSASPISHLDHSLSASESSSACDTRGKHRIQAEIKRLEQEARFLEVSSVFLCKYAVCWTSLIHTVLLCSFTNF